MWHVSLTNMDLECDNDIKEDLGNVFLKIVFFSSYVCPFYFRKLLFFMICELSCNIYEMRTLNL